MIIFENPRNTVLILAEMWKARKVGNTGSEERGINGSVEVKNMYLLAAALSFS